MKFNNPLVSIIIPFYNRAALLPETLDSIINQKYENWECILIDDGSTDNSKGIIKQYIKKDNRFKLFTRPDNYKKGACGSRNYGLTLAKGEFIQQFDSDDLMHEDMLWEKVKVLNKNPEIQSVINRLAFFNEEEIIGEQKPFNKRYPTLYENILTWEIPVWTIALMFRKQFLDDSNEIYDESLIFNDDYDFFGRIFIKHPHKTYLLDKPLSLVRRDHGDSMTSQIVNYNPVALESAYVAHKKNIELLIQEDKLKNSLEKYYYWHCKKEISLLNKKKHNELVEKYKRLIEIILMQHKKKFKLSRFRLCFKLYKSIPVDNLFLVYRNPYWYDYLKRFIRKFYKLVFDKEYRQNKLAKINM